MSLRNVATVAGAGGSGLTDGERAQIPAPIRRSTRRTAVAAVHGNEQHVNPAVSDADGSAPMSDVVQADQPVVPPAAANGPTQPMLDAVRPDVYLNANDTEGVRALAADADVLWRLAQRVTANANELAGDDARPVFADIKHIAPKPPVFTNSAKGPTVRMWLRHVKEYQSLLPPRPSDCVRIAALYLGDAVSEHWYEMRDILEREGKDPNDWELFEGHMLRVYGMIDVDARAREQLDALTLASCGMDMTEYVRQYTNLQALIPARNDHDKCHFFLKGLPRGVCEKIALDPATLLQWDDFDRLCTYACRVYRHAAKTFGVETATSDSSRFKPKGAVPKGKHAMSKAHKRPNDASNGPNGGVHKAPRAPFDAARWAGTLIDSFDKLKLLRKEGRCIFCGDKGHRGNMCKKNPSKGKGKEPN